MDACRCLERNRFSFELVSYMVPSAQSTTRDYFISGLRETFIKRDRVQRTNKAEQDQMHRVKKWKVVRRIYGMKYS